LAKEDVGRLQIPMHDPLAVGVVHGPGQRLDQPGGVRRRDAGLARPLRPRQGVVEAAAGHVLQAQERHALGVADLVDLDDVRVLEPGDRLRLPAEPVDGIPAGHAALEHLDRDDAVER
jgi:hypothetical protein